MSKDMNPTGPSTQEKAQRAEDVLKAGIDAILAKERDSWLGEAAAIIERHGKVDRSQVPEILNRDGERVTKTQSAALPLYREFTGETRQIRGPEFDHYATLFLRGVMTNDSASVLRAKAKIDEIHPNFGRADTLEGAADTTGGFADGTGAYLLPRPLERLVEIARDKVAKMARFASTYQMTQQEHNVPTGAAMTAYMQAEATSPSTTGATFAQVPLIARKAVAKAIVGNDLLADSAVNVVNFFTRRGGAALGVLEDEEFFKAGTGSAPHVTKLAGTSFSEATSTAWSVADTFNIYYSVGQQYRGNGVWCIAADVLKLMANVRDGFGRPIYTSLMDPPMVMDDSVTGSPLAGAQGTLLGRPVHEVPLTAGDIYFGDLSAAYAIGRRNGIMVESSRDFLFDTFRTVILISQRIAGNNVDTVAGYQAAGIVSANSL